MLKSDLEIDFGQRISACIGYKEIEKFLDCLICLKGTPIPRILSLEMVFTLSCYSYCQDQYPIREKSTNDQAQFLNHSRPVSRMCLHLYIHEKFINKANHPMLMKLPLMLELIFFLVAIYFCFSLLMCNLF